MGKQTNHNVDRHEAKKMARKWIKHVPMPSSLQREFKSGGLNHLLNDVYEKTADLILENSNATSMQLKHYKQILPCIAFFQTLVQETGSREAALEIYEKWCLCKIIKMAKMIPVLLKIPGLYKVIPGFFKKMLGTTFGPEAGFQFENTSDENGFSTDIVVCPYMETCKKYDCMEIVQFFCKSDDYCYGNMHPKLIWARTQTLGTGGDCCNFKIILKK